MVETGRAVVVPAPRSVRVMPLVGPTLEVPSDISNIVRDRAGLVPEETAIVSSHSRMTWSELNRAADRWAGALDTLGISMGERVASLMPNRVDLAVHYLGCIRAGVVAVPLNYRYVATQIDHALDVSATSVILAHVERSEDLGSTARARPSLRHIWYDDDGGAPGSFASLMSEDHPPPARPTDPAHPAFIFFTSGSTGPAKGVTHSRETVGWMVAIAAAAFEMTDQDVFLPASSMSHLGAFLWTLTSLGQGARVVVARGFEGDELLPLIRQHRPTLLAMIPAALTALIRDHGVTREDFASLRLCRAGSDHVPIELDHDFRELAGFPIDEGYGMTEVGLAALNPPSGEIREGSIGVTVPGFTISLRDDEGDEVPIDAVGRLWMRTPSATVGYWENPEATEKLWSEGWLDSGDLARRDSDGYLWFYGRAKQIIVHDGSNISPQEVEDALLRHPDVSAVGVVGIHDELHGENVRAYVSTLPGAPRPTSQDLIRFARARVGYRAPEEVVFIDQLPLNPTGKVDHAGLKAMAEDHRNPFRSGN